MHFTNDSVKSHDGTPLVTYTWECKKPRALVYIVHGMSEYAVRYDDFANYLTQSGFQVYSSDIRGHGKTAGDLGNVGQLAMNNGWNKAVEDIKFLIEHFSSNLDLPVIILGHSMGSFLLRTLMYTFPKIGDAYILSATAGHPGFIGTLGKSLAHINMKLMGKKNRSNLMTKLAFGNFNKKDKDPRTEKDWLSRDSDVVDAYIKDPYCMQVFTSQFYTDLLQGILEINSQTNINRTSKHKPIYLFAGDMDPVGNYGLGPEEVYTKLLKAGVEDVLLKMYPEGRHEMLNEINKSEVRKDILNWLNSRLDSKNDDKKQ